MVALAAPAQARGGGGGGGGHVAAPMMAPRPAPAAPAPRPVIMQSAPAHAAPVHAAPAHVAPRPGAVYPAPHPSAIGQRQPMQHTPYGAHPGPRIIDAHHAPGPMVIDARPGKPAYSGKPVYPGKPGYPGKPDAHLPKGKRPPLLGPPTPVFDPHAHNPRAHDRHARGPHETRGRRGDHDQHRGDRTPVWGPAYVSAPYYAPAAYAQPAYAQPLYVAVDPPLTRTYGEPLGYDDCVAPRVLHIGAGPKHRATPRVVQGVGSPCGVAEVYRQTLEPLDAPASKKKPLRARY